MVRFVIASVIGGIVLFVWAYVSWMFIPWHMINGLPREQKVAQALVDTGAESGIYSLPGIDYETHAGLSEEARKTAEEAWKARYEAGPIALIVYKTTGQNPMSLVTLLVGFVLEVLVAAVAALLLRMAAPALPGFVARVGFVLLLGVFVIFAAHLMNWNYMHYPLGFTLQTSADGLVASLLLGIVLAALIRPGFGHGGVADAADFPPDAAG
jgi:hypothetical protein